MKHIRQDPYIERGWIRFVGTRGFFFCFAAATAAAIVVGFLRGGIASVTFPLLVWSPFLLLISLHMASHAIRQSRDHGAPVPRGATRRESAWGFTIDLAGIALYLASFSMIGRATVQSNSLNYLPLFLFLITDAASHGLCYVGLRWGPVIRRAIPPVILFCLAIYLAIGALWLLPSMRARG